MNTKPVSVLCWFRNDLRLHDNEMLHKATQKTKNIVAVYCFDPRYYQNNELGIPRTGYLRAKFTWETVLNLKKNLQNIGSDLVIKIGKPEEIIPELAQKHQCSWVYSSQEFTAEELQIEQQVEKKLWQQGINYETFYTSTLLVPLDLPFPMSALPDVFTQFRKEVESSSKIRPCYPAPTMMNALPEALQAEAQKIPTLKEITNIDEPPHDRRAVLSFEGGENAALARLQVYFWEKKLLSRYKETRNGLLGADYSSKFSTWLAVGAISPRKIYEEIKLYEQKIIKNDSTYWLVFELLWRDYFKWVAKKYGNRIFQLQGLQRPKNVEWRQDKTLFQRWATGNTGVAFVDANMRELNLTGFMSNRGRQNVASFLTKDYKINWTWGAMYFEAKLIDYDVCSNWGNWAYIAGVGNDPREDRYFNIEKQAKQYDAKGEYVKLWLTQ
ncbi:MAG: DASH family cryptochrome [Cytophagales bacterium]|nr:MAG: DASH family cryptochrome [Cytophagales bacterium]